MRYWDTNTEIVKHYYSCIMKVIQLEQCFGFSSSSGTASEEEVEEDDLKGNIPTVAPDTELKKDNVTDLSLIRPTMMLESENTMSSLAMSKVLLERLLLRKELRLNNMKEKLEDQAQMLEAAKRKVAEYEKMIGFRKFLFLSKLCSKMVWFGVRRASGARRGAGKAVTSFYQLILSLVYHIPLHLLSLLPTTLTLSMADLAHYLGNLMARRAENISNECVERVEWEQEKERVERVRRRTRP